MQFPALKVGQVGAIFTDSSQAIANLEGPWVVFFSPANTLGIASKPESFDTVLCFSNTCTDDSIEKLFTLMTPGASLSIYGQTKESMETLNTSLLLNGFVDAVTSDSTITCKKPGFKQDAMALPQKSKTAKDVWKLAANDFNDDAEVVDDDDLLGEEIKKPATKAEDCGPETKKRACKNCVCGLKEIQEAESKGEPVTIQPDASACGGCAKGDAFRCATCPYLGLPKFESGTKPEIKVKADGSKVLLDTGSDWA